MTWPEHSVPQQLHLDLMVDSVAELDAVHEQARLVSESSANTAGQRLVAPAAGFEPAAFCSGDRTSPTLC
jgi:hypothetical protein